MTIKEAIISIISSDVTRVIPAQPWPLQPQMLELPRDRSRQFMGTAWMYGPMPLGDKENGQAYMSIFCIISSLFKGYLYIYIYICTYIWLTQPSFKFWTCSPCFVFIQTLKTCKCCLTVWDSLFLGHFDQMSSNLARSFFWWFMSCISFFLHPNSLYSKSFVIMSSLDSIF